MFNKKFVVFILFFVSAIASVYPQVGSLTTIVQQGHKVNISNVCYSPDGNNFITYSSTDNSAMLWSRQGQLIKTIPLSYQVRLEFTPDGKHLIGKDELFDLKGERIREYSPGRNNGVSCSKISPDGKIVALGLDNTKYSE